MTSEEERSAFEHLASGKLNLWPEIGSRTFLQAFGKPTDQFDQSGDWIVVQPDRYRYAVAETDGVLVRMVLREYLACEVVWGPSQFSVKDSKAAILSQIN